jgi:diguanylate cyclase (GGDEF)-like protein
MQILKLLKHVVMAHAREFVVFLTLAFCWCTGAWIVSGVHAKQRIDDVLGRERNNAKIVAENIAFNINQNLMHVRSVPVILAHDSGVTSALLKLYSDSERLPLSVDEKRSLWDADAELRELTLRLGNIRDDVGLHTLFVLNADGDCIAAGKSPDLPSFIGLNYSDRQYFLAAQKNKNGRQFAVGRTDNIGALFYSTPVLAHGQFLGAVVSRIDIKSLTSFVLDQDVFVTDENGVVILARDSDILMKALPGARVLESGAEDFESVYRKSNFEQVELNPVQFEGFDDVVQWRNAKYPFIYAKYATKDELVTVHVLRDARQVFEIKSDRILWFGVTSFSGIISLALVFGIVAYVRSISRHRQELLCLNENLAQQARTDALTGCANRRNFFEMLEAERQRGIRYGLPFSMLSLDIDGFKQVNDIYGHPGGDQVLRHFVSVVEKMIRPTDCLGRVGGEEFGILLPQTTGLDAAAIAERVREAVEQSPARYEQEMICYTVSVGVSQWLFDEAESIHDFVSRCDKALYQAKGRGRNQVKIAEWCILLEN